MRLADFISANIEPILAEWEVFARSIWPTAAAADPAELRNDAEAILHGTVADMASGQTAAEQSDKSKGRGRSSEDKSGIDRASRSHGAGRVGSGFEMWAVVAEYRALRASVLRLWRESGPTPDLHDLDDVTRFNESIDQSLTDSVRSYIEKVERDRTAILANEQASRLEAESANRAKDMFLATLSHEMRTPLNAIVGWMSILRQQDCDNEDLKEGLDVIDRSTKAQVQLIDDVLDVSRIVSGKLRVEIGPCELDAVINAGVDSVRPAAEARDITLDVQLDPSASCASCDATRIQQVVWNLVSNAVKFTPKGGRISVTLARHQSSTVITIRDNGTGISPELLPYVFDRFRQADSSARRTFGGLGLGLSIVKYLVEAHGGTVEAHSPGEGKGSTFIVRLPIRAVRRDEDNEGEEPNVGKPDADHLVASSTQQVRFDGLRILVVDDEADARRILVKVLEQAGAIVTAAGSAGEALEILPKDQPNVLVSDLGMPHEDGFYLIRQVRAGGHTAQDLPAVALTAFANKDDERMALAAGFQVHVAKPVDPYELASVIASLVGRRG